MSCNISASGCHVYGLLHACDSAAAAAAVHRLNVLRAGELQESGGRDEQVLESVARRERSPRGAREGVQTTKGKGAAG